MNHVFSTAPTDLHRDPARRSAGTRPAPPAVRTRHRVAPPRPADLRLRAARLVARLADRGAAAGWRRDPSPLEVAVRHCPRFDVRVDTVARVLVLSGEMDLAAVNPFTVASASLTVGRRGGVTLDLRALRFIDAAGLGAIVALNNVLGRGGQRLTLRGPGPRIRRMFVLGGLSELAATASG